MSATLAALVLYAGKAGPEEPMSEECVIPDLVLAPTTESRREPADLALVRAGRATLLGVDGRRFVLLEAPGCRLRDIPLEGSVLGFASSYTIPDGRALYLGDGWRLGGGGEPPRRIAPPPELLDGRPPILANDGRAVAWLVKDPAVPPRFIYGRGTYYVPRVLVSPLGSGSGSGPSFFIPLPAGTLANEHTTQLPRLLALDLEQKELTLAVEDVEAAGQGTPRYLAVDLGGALRWGPIPVDGVPHGLRESLGFRRLGAGWVAWGDSLNVSEAPLRIVWSLPSGRSVHRVKTPMAPFQHPRIDSAEVSPDGEHIAVSVGLHTRMLLSKGRTYVFRVRDGRLVFDHTMSGANGSPVAFLGNDRFCYSDYDKKKQAHATHVVRLQR